MVITASNIIRLLILAPDIVSIYCFNKMFIFLVACSWCLFCFDTSLITETSSYCATSCDKAGPAAIHLLSDDGSLVIPTAPPSPLMTTFACSCAWSIASHEKFLSVLWTTNFPAWNASTIDGCRSSNASMSSRCIGSHRA